MNATVKEGHVLDVLAGMPAESCHCVVTSPPYWGLRDYGESTKAQWEGYESDNGRWHDPWHGQLGLEPTIDMYVEHIVEVFRAVRRVLRKDGTLWLNVGDSYTSGNRATWRSSASSNKGHDVQNDMARPRTPEGLQGKDLIGQPWRIAFALQADGWIMRSDIIWAKPNPQMESSELNCRPVKSHENVFLLAKSQQNFWDAFALRKPNGDGRDLLDVWHIPTEAVKEAHFATFPRRLAERCIKAGTSERGCCPECGAPWVRVVETERVPTRQGNASKAHGRRAIEVGNRDPGRHVSVKTTIGWCPGADRCVEHGTPIPCTVLDPFCGSGQCGIAATQLGRAFIGIEINPEYAAMARRRIANPEPLPEIVDVPGQMELEL